MLINQSKGLMKLRLFSLAVLALFLHSCSVSTLPRFSPPGSLSRLMQNVKKGMTPEEVAKLAGTEGPYSRNFHKESEEWVYKERFGISYRVYFEGGRVVAFDDGSRVGYYSSPSPTPSPSTTTATTPAAGNTTGQARVISREEREIIARERAERQREHRSGEGDKWFDRLQEKLRSSFSSEREAVLRRALATRYITAEQAAKLVSQFSFSDEKWRALQMCIPAIMDFEELKPLYDLFPFSSDRQKIDKWVDQEIERRISSRSIVY